MRSVLPAFVALSCVTFPASVSHAGAPVDERTGYAQHTVRIPRLAKPAALSTDLTSAPWTDAVRLTGNLDWRRARTADVPVESYLFYDAENLWVAYRSEATPGDKLKATVTERDKELKGDDFFLFELDVALDGRVFYKFQVNPAGAFSDSGTGKSGWNSKSEWKASRDAKGWTAVIRIPFADLGRGEPAAGETWSFNVSTRSGLDNCWAPVLGAYHEPERFAHLVFGGENLKPARILAFKPLHAGPNEIRVQCAAPTRALIEAQDADGQCLSRFAGPVGADGRVSFDLLNDQTHHVNFTFTDASGTVLLRFWRPAEIPPLLSRLPALQRKAAMIRKSLPRFPDALKSRVEKQLGELDALVATPGDSVYARWNELHRQFVALDRPLTDAWLFATTLEQVSDKATVAVAFASPMQPVMIKDFTCPGRGGKTHELALARNEHEAVQLVTTPMIGDLKELTVSASPAVATDGSKLDGRVSVSLVGHVKTKEAGSYLPDYTGWYPDPILDFQQSCDAKVGEHIAFWIDVATTHASKPGRYASRLTVSAKDAPPLELTLNITVWNVDLPEGSHLKTAFTYTEPAAKKLYKGKWTPQLARRYHDFILDHRLNIDGLYGKEERDPELMKYGMSRGMNAFNIFYLGKNVAPEVVEKSLKERMPRLEAAGVDKLAYIYGFDEMGEGMFPKIRQIFGLVKQLYPNMARVTTSYDNTFGRRTGMGDYIDVWVPLVPKFNAIEAQRLRSEGKDMWWYVCVGPRHPYPNFFVESPGYEQRLLMGAMSYKFGAGGLLYFLSNGWKNNDRPITSGPYTDWYPGSGKDRNGAYANGDGSIFCAGPDGPVTTTRYENIRDGLEDYELLYMLAAKTDAIARQPATIQRATFVQRARELLTVPNDVVASAARYTDDPEKVYAFRAQVAALIEQADALTR